MDLEIVSGKRPGVTNAGGAAVADQVEAERLEVVHQVRAFQVVGDDLRAGGQRRLDPRLASQAERPRLASHEAGADHDVRV